MTPAPTHALAAAGFTADERRALHRVFAALDAPEVSEHLAPAEFRDLLARHGLAAHRWWHRTPHRRGAVFAHGPDLGGGRDEPREPLLTFGRITVRRHASAVAATWYALWLDWERPAHDRRGRRDVTADPGPWWGDVRAGLPGALAAVEALHREARTLDADRRAARAAASAEAQARALRAEAAAYGRRSLKDVILDAAADARRRIAGE